MSPVTSTVPSRSVRGHAEIRRAAGHKFSDGPTRFQDRDTPAGGLHAVEEGQASGLEVRYVDLFHSTSS